MEQKVKPKTKKTQNGRKVIKKSKKKQKKKEEDKKEEEWQIEGRKKSKVFNFGENQVRLEFDSNYRLSFRENKIASFFFRRHREH